MTHALPRILVAEDEPANRALMAAMLQGHAAPVFAEDGRRALALLSQGGWAGTLIDVRMPVMDGLACIRAWRAHEAEHGQPRLTALACTANVRADEVAAIREAGFDGHLPKPVNLTDLRGAVAERFAAMA